VSEGRGVGDHPDVRIGDEVEEVRLDVAVAPSPHLVAPDDQVWVVGEQRGVDRPASPVNWTPTMCFATKAANGCEMASVRTESRSSAVAGVLKNQDGITRTTARRATDWPGDNGFEVVRSVAGSMPMSESARCNA
jgi:hypothetical protein